MWRRSRRHPLPWAAAAVLAALAVSSCGGFRYSALMNPTVDVNVRHVPTLGLGIERVTISSNRESSTVDRIVDLLSDDLGLSPDVCGAELRQRVTQMLLEGGLQVTREDDPARARVRPSRRPLTGNLGLVG